MYILLFDYFKNYPRYTYDLSIRIVSTQSYSETANSYTSCIEFFAYHIYSEGSYDHVSQLGSTNVCNQRAARGRFALSLVDDYISSDYANMKLIFIFPRLCILWFIEKQFRSVECDKSNKNKHSILSFILIALQRDEWSHLQRGGTRIISIEKQLGYFQQKFRDYSLSRMIRIDKYSFRRISLQKRCPFLRRCEA